MTQQHTSAFVHRAIGSSDTELKEMLDYIGASSIEDVISRTIPSSIRYQLLESVPTGSTESDYIEYIHQTAGKNKLYKQFIGRGYYGCFMPPVIKRNILESAGWYTPYTPYQAEISQGRLEGLFYFQSMICDLTQLPISNASLLDEATAAAEAMVMLYTEHKKKNNEHRNTYFLDQHIFTQTKNVMRTRARSLGIELIEGDAYTADINGLNVFGLCLQRPNSEGDIISHESLMKRCETAKIAICVIADIMSICLINPPGEFGASIVVGSTQRFGIPIGYGGPSAAYIACRENLKRLMPGRIIGKTVDNKQRKAYRMALQTREQHIRREKATSNICTAQALLANISAMYAVYHGPEGVTAIAKRIAALTHVLKDCIDKSPGDHSVLNESYFDTLKIKAFKLEEVRRQLEAQRLNVFYYPDKQHIGISLDELTSLEDVNLLLNSMGIESVQENNIDIDRNGIREKDERKTRFLEHPIFHNYRSETGFLRYVKSLEQKDVSLVHSMIPLGSCTMKLNPASTLVSLSMSEFADIHPLAPVFQTEGYQEIISSLKHWLCVITGFDACSLQPNSGAQGEYAGLLCIKLYLDAQGETQRKIILIPSSAHGTNPASAIMAGFSVKVVPCSQDGSIDIEELEKYAEDYKKTLAGLMITYPSTHGVFESNIQKVCQIIHEKGGQVYLDGANMNAQIGLTSLVYVGADVCHLNLHKTFSIPHGGGGPGAGPICVKEHLKAFLPSERTFDTLNVPNEYCISAAPHGNASILLISHAYIFLMGRDGLRTASERAILHANYMKARLAAYYPILYLNHKDMCAHEFIIDIRPIKKTTNISVEDIAKRLLDYGLHAPTVSFPVMDTMMIEPTESETKEELDRYCDSLIQIRKEIADIEQGIVHSENSVLRHAPHTMEDVIQDVWKNPYTRQQAAFPLPFVAERKCWPKVGRINQSQGDRHLICSCMPVSYYEDKQKNITPVTGA